MNMNHVDPYSYRLARHSLGGLLWMSLGCSAVGDLGNDDRDASSTSVSASSSGARETTSSSTTTSSTDTSTNTDTLTSGLASTSADVSGASSEGTGTTGDEGASSESEETTGLLCAPEDCEDIPRPNAPCADGSTPSATCVPFQGACGWYEECGVDVCTDAECGQPPPTALCPDGMTHSGIGPCERRDDGICAYEIYGCPLCCSQTTLPDCPEPITCCADSSWHCGPPEGCPDGATAFVCVF